MHKEDRAETRSLTARIDAGVPGHPAQSESEAPASSTTWSQPLACRACKQACMAQSSGWLACLPGGACGCARGMPCPGAAQAVKALSASHMSRVCCRATGAAAAE